MSIKIFASNYPFGRENPEPRNLLKQTGWDIIYNPYERKLKPEETAEMAKGCDGIVAGTEDLTPLIESSDRLRVISRIGIGLDSVPLDLCRRKGITVTYTPDAVTMAVVEMAVSLMVMLSRRLSQADHEIRKGLWPRHFGKRISESVIGIVGLGRVGFRVANYLAPFRPKEILINDIKDVSEKIESLQKAGLNARFAEKAELFEKSDVVTVHTPLSPLTKGMVNRSVMESMKRDSFLINTARGGIIPENDLYEILKEKRIGGAAVDVFEHEPYAGPLTELDNVFLTQHQGSCSFDCRLAMETEAVMDCIRFFRGETLKTPVPDEEYEYQKMA